MREFVLNGLVPDAARSRFDAAIASALRLRNSVVAELLLLAFVYAVGDPVRMARPGRARREQLVRDRLGGPACSRSLAGWWAALVAMPVFQFLCLRWYFRMLIWARFMWQVSRIDLNLEPLHPDGTAGLHFLALVGTRVPACPARARHGARRNDGQPDLLHRREAARLQGGNRRHGGDC